MPNEYHQKIFKSLSQALFEIYSNQHLKERFIFYFDERVVKEKSQKGTTPLHFAMRSRNEGLTALFLKEDYNVFERN